MRKTLLTIALSLLVTFAGFAQGTMIFGNYFFGEFCAPLFAPDPANSTLALHGQGTFTGSLPLGTVIYNGSALQGTGFTLQVWTGDSAEHLAPAFTTTFRTATANKLPAGLMSASQIVSFAGVLGGSNGVYEVRVWDNKGGTVTTWADALQIYINRSDLALGTSGLVTSAPLGGLDAAGNLHPETPYSTNWASFNIAYQGPLETPPVIIQQPVSKRVVAGQNASFAVFATGTWLNYQWLFNGTNLPGATSSSLTITNAQLADAGTYSLRIVGYMGTAVSSNAELVVLPVGSPEIYVNGQVPFGTVPAVGYAQVTIAGGFPNGFIFYTLDGTPPTTSSSLYTGPITLTSTATLRAISLSADFSQISEAPAVNVQILPVYTLQTSVVGSGTIGMNPSGGSYASNSVVTLTATPAAHWSFDHWTGDVSGSANPVTVTMNGPHTVQAVFVQSEYPLTVGSPGGGTVTANGQTISSPTFYPAGTMVSLAAVTNSGWSFLNWQGNANGTNNPLSLTMNRTNNVQAIFGTEVRTNILGAGSIVLSPTNPVPYGTQLTATAVAAPGNYLKLWSGAANGTNNSATVLVTNATPTIGALFAPVPAGEWTLNVVVNGTGTVAINPQKPYYDPGDTVTLTASTTNAATPFSGWSGDAVSMANPLSVLMNTNKVIVATFGSAPAVSISPQSVTVLAGSNAVLNAAAGGLPPLTFQWFHGAQSLAGATNTSYGISNAQASDAGSYTVVVTNPYGSATSSVATVTVVFPPSITQQPSSAAVPAGTALSLSVGTSGSEPLSYQWMNSVGPIAGATKASYTISPIQTNNADAYFVVVTNAYGAITSTVATVTVYIPVSILAQPASRIAPARSTVSFSVLAAGYPDPTYQWRFWGTNLPGATASSLTITNVRLADLGDYAVFVNNGYSSSLSDSATLSMSPTITTPFIGATAIWGRNASLSVSAIGSGLLNFQWYKDWVPLASGTNQTLELPTVQPGDSGFYSVVVSSDWGSVTNSAQLVVNPVGMDLGLYAGITLNGAAGYTYEIQYTTDLTVSNSWITLTNLTLEQPVQIWVDTTTNAAATHQRFYRILPRQ